MEEKKVFDLRKLKCGSWKLSQIKTKVNGHWLYFYEPETNKLINFKEPINFEKKYVPPNHADEKMEICDIPPLHPAKTAFLQSKRHSKAPLVFSEEFKHRQFSSPIVYQQFSDTDHDHGTKTAKISGRQIIPHIKRKAITSMNSRHNVAKLIPDV